MDTRVIQKDALQRVKEIHKLSEGYNKTLSANHSLKLIDLIKEHAQEIQQLHKEHNRHYLTETGDLIVLCFELLLENQASIDETMNKCFIRYETKLPKLLQEASE